MNKTNTLKKVLNFGHNYGKVSKAPIIRIDDTMHTDAWIIDAILEYITNHEDIGMSDIIHRFPINDRLVASSIKYLLNNKYVLKKEIGLRVIYTPNPYK